MTSSPRLLIDLSVAPPGGAGTYADGFIAGLLDDPTIDRSNLVILLDRAWAAERSAAAAKLRAAGAVVDELDLPKPGTWEARLRRGATTREAIGRHHPDLSYFPRDVAPRRVAPYVLLANNLFAWKRHGGADAVGGRATAALLRRAAHRSARDAAAVFAVSGPMADAVAATSPVRTIVHHGCSLPESRPRPTARDRRPRALTVGNLYANKRFDVAVRGVARARYLGVPYELDLVGGNESGETAQLLDRLGQDLLHESVVRGPAYQDALVEAYQRADVLIVTTSFESFCYPLIEGMRSGCVVVAPETPLVHEICGGHAITYREGDEDALGAALCRAWDEHHRRAEEGRVFARRYTWPSAVATTLSELEAVARGR